MGRCAGAGPEPCSRHGSRIGDTQLYQDASSYSGWSSDCARVTASCRPRSNLSSRTQIRALLSERKVSNCDGNDESLDRSSGRDSTSVRTMSQPVVDDGNPSHGVALSVSRTEEQDLGRK